MKPVVRTFVGTILVAGWLAACGSSEGESTFKTTPSFGGSLNDDGGMLGNNNNGQQINRGDGTGCAPNLTGRLRDFNASHPDFEDNQGDDRNIVADMLGADFKPVYKGSGSTTTSGKASFDQWYRDVPGVNEASDFTLTLTKQPDGTSTYQNDAFFPLDGKGLGNEGRDHNFHFTYELHTEFSYKGGEVFTFTGDDDLFAFINGKLAINLGGVHTAQIGTVNLDEKAAELGITKGNTYGMSVFHAERHTVESHFRIDTSIAFTNCQPIIR